MAWSWFSALIATGPGFTITRVVAVAWEWADTVKQAAIESGIIKALVDVLTHTSECASSLSAEDGAALADAALTALCSVCANSGTKCPSVVLSALLSTLCSDLRRMTEASSRFFVVVAFPDENVAAAVGLGALAPTQTIVAALSHSPTVAQRGAFAIALLS